MHEERIAYLLHKAQQAGDVDVPIHALITQNNEILAESGNTREKKNTPLAHAEVDVIEKACQKLQNWRLLNTTLYVLVEPCLMCTGVIFAARIPKVVFGVKNPKGGALLHAQENRKSLGLNHSVSIEYGFCEDDIKNLLSSFFLAKRG